MRIIDKVHKLSNEEINLLQNLVGKTLISIHSHRHYKELDGHSLTNCVKEIFFSFKGDDSFVRILAEFDETNFGDDFITFKISKVAEIERFEQVGKKFPTLRYELPNQFLITKIEVLGGSYYIESDNDSEMPIWNVERENLGTKIRENIENENVLLFYSQDNMLLVRAYTPMPIVEFTLDSDFITSSLSEKNKDGKLITKLKRKLS